VNCIWQTNTIFPPKNQEKPRNIP